MKYFTSPLTTFAALFPLALGSAQAATKTLGGASTAWTNATVDSWTPLGLPTTSDNVVIASTGTSDARGSALLQTGSANGTATIQDLAFNSTAAITLINNSTSANTTLTLSGGRGVGVPLLAATGDFAYAITSPGTSTAPKTLTLSLGASGDIDVAANTGTNALTISAIISGAQSLNKTGAGRLVLSGANTFSGGLTHSAGILRAVTNPAALGAGTLTLTGANLQLAGAAAVAFNRPTTVTASTTITSDKLAAGAGVTHTLGTLSIGAQTLSVAAGTFSTTGTAGVAFGATTVTGAAILSPATLTSLTLGATDLGANLLTIAGAGATTVGAVTTLGTANLARTGAGAATIGTIGADTVNLNVTAAGTTTIAGVTNTTGPLSIVATGAGAGAATINGVSSTGTVTLTTTATAVHAVSGLVATGSGGFVKAGTGRSIMTGAATFTAGSTVNAGILEVTSNGGLGTGPVVINTAATLEINLAAAVLTTSGITVNPGGRVAVRNITVTAPITLAGGNLGTRSGLLGNFAGPISVTADSTATLISYTTPTINQSITISGLLSGSSALGVVGGATANNGAVALILTNPANTFSGAFNVATGQRLSSIPTTTGSSFGTGTVNLAANSFLRINDNGTGSDGTITYNNAVNTAGAATIDLDRASGANTGNTIALGPLTAAAGTITVNTANNYKASLPSVTLTGNVTLNSAGTISLPGTVTGASSLAMSGTGTLNVTGSIAGALTVGSTSILTGTGTIGGTTTVANTGTINLGAAGPGSMLTTNALTFGTAATDTSTINFSTGINASTINVTGTDGLTVTSDGTGVNVVTVNLQTVLPEVGTHTVIDYAGTIQGTGLSGFKLGPLLNPRINAVLIDDGSRIALNVISVDTPRWSGASSSEWSTAAIASPKNWQLVLAPGPADYIEGDNVLFNDDAASGAVQLTVADVTPRTVVFDNSVAKAYTLSGTKAILGATGLVKTKDGLVTISNVNNFTGPVSISTGTVSVNSLADSGANSALGAGTGITLAAGGTLEFTGATGSSNRPVTVQTGGATIKSSTSAGLTLTGAVTLADTLTLATEGTTAISSALAGTHGITVNGVGTTTLSGNVTATGGLTKNGTGTTILTGAANTSALTIAAGVMTIGNGTTLPGSTGTGLITNNGTLAYNTPNTATAPAVTTVTSANHITGTGELTKTGPGYVVLSGATANDYTGTTTVSGGNLILSKSDGVNAIGGNLIVESGGTVSYGTTALQLQDHIPDTATITINGGTFGSGAGATLAAPTQGVTDTVAAVVLNSGTFLSGRNAAVTPFTLTGAFNAVAGSIQVQRGGGLSADSFTLASGVVLDFDGGSTTAGQTSKLLVGPNGLHLSGNVLRMNNGPSVITAATSAGSVLALGGNVTTTGTNQVTRTAAALKAEVELGAAARTFDVTGTLDLGTAAAPVIIVGTGGLTKAGAGTMALTGVNTYTGPTTVQTGILTLDGSVTSPVIDVKAGATFHTLTATGLALSATQTLTGSGTVQVDTAGIATVAGAKLVPGTDGTVGMLTVAPTTKLDLSGTLAPVAPTTAALKFDLATPAASDKIDLTTGTLDIGAGLLELDDIAFTTLAGYASGTYTLISTNAAITGTLGAGVTGTVGGRTATLSLGDGGTDLILTVSGSLTAQQNWRNTFFGITTNTGDAANTADPDFDGVANVLEYLLGSDPTKGGQLGDVTVSDDGTNLTLTYSRVKATLSEVTPTVETSSTLSPTWVTTGVTTIIFSDNGTIQVIKASVPIAGDKRFLRLRADSAN